MNETLQYRRMGEWANRRMGDEFPSPTLPFARSRIGAFSLIELMVVMGIIAILAGITFVAVKSLTTGSQTKETRATLDTLRGMLTEYENATHFNTAPTYWEWQPSNMSGGAIIREPFSPAPTDALPDFWRVPGWNTSLTPNFPDPLVAPASVTPGQADRDGSIAVINTQIAMGELAGLTVNRAVIDKLPTGSTEQLVYVSGKVSGTTGDVNNGNGTSRLMAELPNNARTGVVQPNTANNEYVIGVVTQYTNAGKLTYARWTGAALGNSKPPGGNWTDTSQPGPPIFLDAWGNPIIFVPGSGLMVRMSARVTATNKYGATLIQSPDHKPFWASAGPDGDFSNGDDNIYSFEQ